MRIALLNQTFFPDVAGSAQYATDLVAELVRRGHEVTVMCGRHAYDQPDIVFSKREEWNGVHIHRIGHTALGKKSLWRRVFDLIAFTVSCAFALTRLPRFDTVVAMTSPPLLPFLGALRARRRGEGMVLWLLDLNPDEAIALGWLDEQSLVTRFLRAQLRYSLRVSRAVIVLDRFMAERVRTRGITDDRLAIIPLWSRDDAVQYSPQGRAAFRQMYGLEGKFVVMYSGNHSPCHPLETLLGAAKRLAEDPRIMFCFVGGGSEFPKVQAFAAKHKLPNTISLPYQPLNLLSASLSAADLHVVVMGEAFVGVVHPCKVYNIMSFGIPFLYLGPSPSPVTDFAESASSKWMLSAAHGDVETVVQRILGVLGTPKRHYENELRLAARFSHHSVVPRLADAVEQAGRNAHTPKDTREEYSLSASHL